MAIWRAQVEFESTTLLPQDKIVNTWHFEGSETATDLANIDDMLNDFYFGTVAGGTIGANFTSASVTGNYTLKIFCLADPEPRLPRGEFFHDESVGSGTGLPAEVALCLSMQASPVSGAPQARRRGRVYLGPFTAASSSNGRPTTALINQVLAAASQLKAAADASVTWQWVVYSRANAAAVDVDEGWVDNAWDTQRRRGVSSTDRYTFS